MTKRGSEITGEKNRRERSRDFGNFVMDRDVVFFEGAWSVAAGFSTYYISYSFLSNYTNIISSVMLFSYFLCLISNI